MAELTTWNACGGAASSYRARQRVPERVAGDRREAEVDLKKCVNCLLCWIYCPDSAVSWTGRVQRVRPHHCKGCEMCAEVCPVDAVTMVPEEVES